eukprot:gnl/MRDRNA2_/MRDRNA2_220224_c0_seq1.p1 gnl/MRDRNA2_/MRDRNA2_220224_c0~~gnl/MRDRNA2_/MRDRNA2_220224_c0_seq1.p1  ORF type:complete len:217 (+),score=20.28 gnl/MRDRNA2_/MRDRNA2_220224_c0_seq1:27-653(+)
MSAFFAMWNFISCVVPLRPIMTAVVLGCREIEKEDLKQLNPTKRPDYILGLLATCLIPRFADRHLREVFPVMNAIPIFFGAILPYYQRANWMKQEFIEWKAENPGAVHDIKSIWRSKSGISVGSTTPEIFDEGDQVIFVGPDQQRQQLGIEEGTQGKVTVFADGSQSSKGSLVLWDGQADPKFVVNQYLRHAGSSNSQKNLNQTMDTE